MENVTMGHCFNHRLVGLKTSIVLESNLSDWHLVTSTKAAQRLHNLYTQGTMGKLYDSQILNSFRITKLQNRLNRVIWCCRIENPKCRPKWCIPLHELENYMYFHAGICMTVQILWKSPIIYCNFTVNSIPAMLRL